MTRKLLLYKKSDFYKFRDAKKDHLTDIISITKYINNTNLIDSHSNLDMVDISSLSEINNRQYNAEQLIYSFDDEVEFVCEDMKWQNMSYDFRHIFTESEYVFEETNFRAAPINKREILGNNRTLYFYEQKYFFSFEHQQQLKGFIIQSVSKFISQPSLIEAIDPSKVIIDLSCLGEYVGPQSVAEGVVYNLSDDTIYICEETHREKLEFKLRLLFNSFFLVNDSNLWDEAYFANNDQQFVAESLSKHKRIVDLDENELKEFFHNFNDKLFGHSKFKDDFEEYVRTFKLFNRLGEHKILSLFLMGDSGVGKTEVARSIFECLNGKKSLAKINFGNYSNEFSLSSLIGSARGYIGSEDGEIFMKVRDTDVGILLIDEFEKSNTSLFNYFLEVLESGKMTSSLGEEIDLNGFIIVFTSNISAEDYKKTISPELRSRFDYKCKFTALSIEDKTKYVEFRAKGIIKNIFKEENYESYLNLSNYLKFYVDVSNYKNMRDINKQIKKVFLKYISSNNIEETDSAY